MWNECGVRVEWVWSVRSLPPEFGRAPDEAEYDATAGHTFAPGVLKVVAYVCAHAARLVCHVKSVIAWLVKIEAR